MTKEESVQQRLAQMQQAQIDALGGAFEDGAGSVLPVVQDDGINQATVDEAVAKIVAEKEAALAAQKAEDDAKFDAAMVELQGVKDQLVAVEAAKVEVEGKLALDEEQIGKLKGSLEKLASLVDFLRSLP